MNIDYVIYFNYLKIINKFFREIIDYLDQIVRIDELRGGCVDRDQFGGDYNLFLMVNDFILNFCIF